MKKYIVGIFIVGLCAFFIYNNFFKAEENGAPPYQIEDLQPPPIDPYAWLKNWKRPDGQTRVGLQVGHWLNSELPDELDRLRGNTGATGGGKSEWEVNYAIAQETKDLLEAEGIVVDILPSTIPSQYWADVFIAIHADGSTDTRSSGFKIASPRSDYTHKSDTLVSLIQNTYAKATKLPIDENITNNMRGYYAFAWWRYDHAVHPMTTSAILETGFLTSPSDRRIIVSKPEVSAKGLSDGILEFLKLQNLIPQDSSLTEN